MKKHITMRAGNKGLTVRVNLWPADDLNWFTAHAARLWIKGQVTNADTQEAQLFNDAGELLSILGNETSANFTSEKAIKAHPKKLGPRQHMATDSSSSMISPRALHRRREL